MRASFSLLALPLVAACSANGVTFEQGTSSSSSSGSSSGSAGGGTGGKTGTGGGTSTGGSTGTGGTGLIFDAGPLPDGGPAAPAEVFGQSAGTLYKLDPVTKVVTTVGNFTAGCATEQVIDIALDKDGNMFATTFGGFYKVDKTTAACTHIATGSYPNSLSFVPKGTLDPNVEALVGYDFSNNYIRIDTTTGAITTVGPGVLSPYASSGDIVSVIGGGTYLTVTGGPDGTCGDCIVKVDPKTGKVLQNIGHLTYGSVYGLAFWGGSAYGFSAQGNLFEIDLTSAACTNIPIPNMPAGYTWYGAGSTTSAPLTPTM